MIPLIGDSRFSHPARVVQLSIERTEDKLGLRLTLENTVEKVRLEVRFVGVRQLRFRTDPTDLLGLVLMQCDNVTDRGWEGIRFEIKDYEEEFISFYCEAFDMSFAERT